MAKEDLLEFEGIVDDLLKEEKNDTALCLKTPMKK